MQVVEVEHNQIQMQESGGTNQQNKEMKMQFNLKHLDGRNKNYNIIF